MNKKPLILICDDEPGVRESLKVILEDDYRIIEADNGEGMLAQARSEKPALILLDVKMPRLNGLEALKTLKSEQPKSKVIMISGYESVDVASQAMRLGADDYMVKPFDKETVLLKAGKFAGGV